MATDFHLRESYKTAAFLSYWIVKKPKQTAAMTRQSETKIVRLIDRPDNALAV